MIKAVFSGMGGKDRESVIIEASSRSESREMFIKFHKKWVMKTGNLNYTRASTSSG
jgi:hypothetical protein